MVEKKEVERFSPEEWDAMTKEQKDEVITLNPDAIPEAVKSELEEEEKSKETKENETPEGLEKIKEFVKGLKDSRGVSVENILDQLDRVKSKENKTLKESVEELEEKLEELRDSTEKLKEEETLKQPAQKGDDIYTNVAKQLKAYHKGGITFNEAGEAELSEAFVSDMLKIVENTAGAGISRLRDAEKKRSKQITNSMKSISKEDRSLYGDDIREELESLDISIPITKDMVTDAYFKSKGKNSDKLIAETKKSLEADLRKEMGVKEKREIEGEETDGSETKLPGSGSSATGGGNKRPTPTQIRLARARNITVQEQMALDESLKKKKEKLVKTN